MQNLKNSGKGFSVNTSHWRGNFRVQSNSGLSMLYRKAMLKVAKFHELASNKEMKILDVGCGYGTSLSQLSRLGYTNLYGVEPDEDLSQHIPKNIAEVRQGKAEKIPYPDETFDAVFVNGALHHILGIKQLYEDACEELDRVLKPGGYIFIMEPGRYWTHTFVELISNILGIASKTFKALGDSIFDERAELNFFFKNLGIFRSGLTGKMYQVKTDSYFVFCWIFSAQKPEKKRD
jgi:SAM-dependent methyltransferase